MQTYWEDVDLEDVLKKRFKKKLASLLDSDDDHLRYQASRLLTILRIREGFDVLSQMFSQVDDFASSVWL